MPPRAWELAIDFPRRDGQPYAEAFDAALAALADAEAAIGRIFGQPEGGARAVRPAA